MAAENDVRINDARIRALEEELQEAKALVRLESRRFRSAPEQASGPHLDLIRAPRCYVLYGVKYIDLVSLARVSS